MTQGQHRSWLGILLAVAFALRIGYCAVTSGLGGMETDYREYVIVGQRLLTHNTLLSPFVPETAVGEPSALIPPAYVGIVAAVYGLVGVETYWATIILKSVNAMASTIVVLLAFLIARRVTGQSAPGWWAAIVTAINPALIGFTDYIWDTNLFALGVTLTIWIALRLSDRPFGWIKWTSYGLWLGGLALLNPALTVAYPLLVLWPLHRSGRLRPSIVLRAVTACVAGWLIAIAPWTVRNYVHFDALMYIRGGFGLEIWLGVCPEADVHGAAVYTTRYPLKNPDVRAHIAQIGERAFIAECAGRAGDAIRAAPIRFLRLIAIRCIDYWAGTTFSHARPGDGGWPRSAPRAAILLFMSAEVLLFGVCVCRARRLESDVRWLAAIVLSFSVVYCLTHVQIRFRAPTEALVVVLIAAAAARAFPFLTRTESA